MNQINLFIELTRIKRPIGFMLLFWPCAWGLTIGYDFSEKKIDYIAYLILFLLGSILMRSAGCIINDIADRKFDKKVFRTRERPIASGKVSVKLGFLYSGFLCLLALIILINFNYLTILLALGSMPLAFTYPLMKRYTYWPQLFLGITFNYGLLLGWTSVTNDISIVPVIFYFGAIFWTLGYDTIYGFQDIKDDEIIGLKSTSIKFKSKPYFFLKSCYSIFLISLIIIGFLLKLSQFYFIFLSIIALQMYYTQIHKLDIKNAGNCLKVFKSNNFLGLLIFINLILGKI
ncbi:4-hydroxybenzoate octaprenyltransferase [Candidatus Pelagibacter sp.]|jgi:4-hydroxybenzoate polyprenyltransferase|nr:4-hydroxybenzoate octaprenyltransferase [Candidatus Pelagibacter sp.]